MSLAGWLWFNFRKNREFRRRVADCDHPKEAEEIRQVGLDWEVRCKQCGAYRGPARR